MSGKTVCKEQCTKCKCIVKERILNEKKSDDCCEDKSDSCEDKGCTEVYRDLGECLKKAIVSAAKKEKQDDC